MAPDLGALSQAQAATVWTRNLDAQIALCQSLEALADGLPDSFDAQQCLHLARGIYPMMRRIHTFEEEVLFPHLQRWAPEVDSLSASLERLRFEHMEDESLAAEIHDALTDYVTTGATENVDVLSYMLRGFFENLTRHVAFEREHLLPLLAEAF